MPKPYDNATHQRVLDAADNLFSQRGYADVTLRDIGAASGIHHSSLYYYAPQGKEQLYIDVMVRNLKRHHEGMTRALAQSRPDIHSQLMAVGEWFLTQPVFDMSRMLHSDARLLKSESIGLLMQQVSEIHQPISRAIQAAIDTGEIRYTEPQIAAFAFISTVQGLNAVPKTYQASAMTTPLKHVVDLIVFGLKGA